MWYQPTWDTPGSRPSFNHRKRNLITCEYCGMAYDGDRYDNCPHCMAPRSDDDANVVFQLPDEPRQQVNCLYADDVLYVSIPSVSSDSEVPVEPGPTVPETCCTVESKPTVPETCCTVESKPTIPETYGTVERGDDAWLAYVISALVVVATFVYIAYIIFA